MDKKGKIITAVMGFIFVSSVVTTGLIFSVDPVVVKQQQFTYELHQEIPTDVESYVRANAKVLSGVSVNLSNVETDKVGVYDAYAEYSGKKYPFSIQIRDTAEPIATLVQTKYEININETLYAKDMIKEVVEDSSYKVYFDEEGKPESKTFTEAKTYNDVFIIVEDEHGNKSQKLRVSVVVKNKSDKPILIGVKDTTIQLNSPFDVLSGVKATDKTDGDLTNKIKVDGKVNTNKVGVYEIVYRVTNSNGYTTSITRKVTVTNETLSGDDSQRDVADGPYLAKLEMRERESVYLTLKRNLFTGNNTLDLVKQMNDYLVKYVEYTSVDVDNKKANSSYGVIKNNIGTDQGFARAFLYMSDMQEIECLYVTGKYNNQNRAWNIVKIGNYYYHIDIAMNRKLNQQFKLYSTQEMVELGYSFDEAKYPVCNHTFNP